MATVLLVDDDLAIVEFCQSILIGMGGLRVLPAASGRQALDVAARQPGRIELLVSDILMPGGITGIELAEQLTHSHPETQVLLMSGSNPDSFAINTSWQFLAKPFHPTDLTSKVSAALATAVAPIDTPGVPPEGHGDAPTGGSMPVALPSTLLGQPRGSR
jgi:two-component system, cell cycle sensor histidine kinase and response regulator CckA